MPAKSQAQQHLMAAAEHGAHFPMAKKLRASMSHSDLHDFAATETAKLPKHVKVPKKGGKDDLAASSMKYQALKGRTTNLAHKAAFADGSCDARKNS